MEETLAKFDYKLVRILGAGAQGTTSIAYTGGDSDNPHIVKYIRSEKVWRREWNVLSRLTGIRGTVELIHKRWIDGVGGIIVTGFIVGKTLTAWLHEGNSLSVSQMIYLASILRELHRRNIYHRDLKPDNVLVSRGDLYIIDYGISCVETDYECLGSSAGTMYFVPNQISERDNFALCNREGVIKLFPESRDRIERQMSEPPDRSCYKINMSADIYSLLIIFLLSLDSVYRKTKDEFIRYLYNINRGVHVNSSGPLSDMLFEELTKPWRERADADTLVKILTSI
jgi:serine/threonine protein kinase